MSIRSREIDSSSTEKNGSTAIFGKFIYKCLEHLLCKSERKVTRPSSVDTLTAALRYHALSQSTLAPQAFTSTSSGRRGHPEYDYKAWRQLALQVLSGKALPGIRMSQFLVIRQAAHPLNP